MVTHCDSCPAGTISRCPGPRAVIYGFTKDYLCLRVGRSPLEHLPLELVATYKATLPHPQPHPASPSRCLQLASPHLVRIFLFLEENGLAFDLAVPENFAIQNDRPVIAQPWELAYDLDGSPLSKNQKATLDLFHFSTLSGGERDLLGHFFKGVSPKSLFNHPVFWTVDRCKCFILDLANSRFDSDAVPTRPLLSNWVALMRESELHDIIKAQTDYSHTEQGEFPYNGFSIVRLAIFTSNMAYLFAFLPFNLVILGNLGGKHPDSSFRLKMGSADHLFLATMHHQTLSCSPSPVLQPIPMPVSLS